MTDSVITSGSKKRGDADSENKGITVGDTDGDSDSDKCSDNQNANIKKAVSI